MRRIKGLPGYEVSSHGRVWSNKRERFLKPKVDKDGYLRVGLWRHGLRHERLVHRLVLEAFVGPCPPGMEACHKDGNPANCRRINLRWGTRKSNHADKRTHRTLARGNGHGKAKLTEKDVLRIVKEGMNSKAQARRYGVSRKAINHIFQGRTWSWLTGVKK